MSGLTQVSKRKSDKWTWEIGGALPPLDPHSRIKHLVIRDYLSRYIQVLMANQQIPRLTLTLVDGFAGGGLYAGDDGAELPGSPLLLLRTIAAAESSLNAGRHTTARVIDAKFHFVETNRSNYAHLAHILKMQGYGADLEERIHLHQADFSEVVAPIVRNAATRLGGERAIFLLDQYSYGEIDFRLAHWILSSLKGSEILLTFNVDSLISFLSDSSRSRKIASKIGLEDEIDWASIRLLKASNRYREGIQRQLAAGIHRVTGARYMTLFFVTPQGASPWSYWLVHLSNVYKANDVMKKIHWDHGNAFGHSLEPGVFQLGYRASRDYDVTGQPRLDFDTPAAFDRFLHQRSVEHLERHLCKALFSGNSGIRFADLVTGLANQTNATADMIKEALHAPVDAGELVALKKGGGYRRKGMSIGNDDVIVARQKSIFLP